MKLLFLTDITAILNELNLRMQGTGQTVMDLCETWNAFVSKLEVYSGIIKLEVYGIIKLRLSYFKHLKEFTVHHNVSVVDIGVYMREIESEFSIGFQDFKRFGPMFSFLIKPDNFEDFDLSAFEWMEIGDFEVQMIDFLAYSLWVSKFIDLWKFFIIYVGH